MPIAQEEQDNVVQRKFRGFFREAGSRRQHQPGFSRVVEPRVTKTDSADRKDEAMRIRDELDRQLLYRWLKVWEPIKLVQHRLIADFKRPSSRRLRILHRSRLGTPLEQKGNHPRIRS
jgi:hypothetical protein